MPVELSYEHCDHPAATDLANASDQAAKGSLAILTLSRPGARNAMAPEDWQQLAAHLRCIEADPEVRAVLLRGADGAFCAGGDLRSMPERLEWPVEVRQKQLLRDGQVIQQLYDLDRIVVAQIEGPCMGAGLSLALACDLRIASSTAQLGAVFHRVGLSGDFGLLWLLPRVVGPARAMQLLMEAEVLSSERAAALDLVHRVVAPAELSATVMTLCRQLVSGPQVAMAMTKRGLRRSSHSDLPTMLEWEAHAQSLLSKTADAKEGVTAFLEKRKPRFSSR